MAGRSTGIDVGQSARSLGWHAYRTWLYHNIHSRRVPRTYYPEQALLPKHRFIAPTIGSKYYVVPFCQARALNVICNFEEAGTVNWP